MSDPDAATTAEPASATYREVLHAPVSWWVLGAALAASVWWVFIVATPTYVAAIAGVIGAALVVAGLVRYGGVVIDVGPAGFRAGRAFLEWVWVGDADPLDPEETRQLLGPAADVRAYLMVRTYCRTAVRVEVDDARDPTPYWLVSTRHADDLARAIRGAAVRAKTVRD